MVGMQLLNDLDRKTPFTRKELMYVYVSFCINKFGRQGRGHGCHKKTFCWIQTLEERAANSFLCSGVLPDSGTTIERSISRAKPNKVFSSLISGPLFLYLLRLCRIQPGCSFLYLSAGKRKSCYIYCLFWTATWPLQSLIFSNLLHNSSFWNTGKKQSRVRGMP